MKESRDTRALARKFGELGQQLVRLPDTEEPPPTTLLNLGRSRRQDDRQRLLANFLTPDRSHGLGHSVTEQFLQGLSTRDDIDFEFSLFDLEDVEVATELLIQEDVSTLWCEMSGSPSLS